MASALRIISLLVALFAIAASALSLNAEPTTGPDDRANGDEDVQAKLDRMLPPIKFDAVSLDDAIDFLRDISGAKFSVDWKALEAAGVARKTAISVNLHNVRFSKALRIILDECGGKNKLGYEIADGVIVVTATPRLTIHSKTYDIHFLFEHIALAERGNLARQLNQLIKDTVDPDSWSVKGRSCKIDAVKGELIVAQTTENQKGIENLIAQLREGGPAPAK